jgi:hypothetical protein
MTNPTPTDGTRWRGFSHEDLYKMLHDGPGAAASAAPSRRWAEVAATLTEISQDLKKALDLTGAGWTGAAAGAAYERLSTTVDWASTTGSSAAEMRVSVEDQAGHIAKARAAMPAPEGVPAAAPDPTVAPAVTVLQAQTDAEPAEAAASSAEEKAVAVMTAYENDTNTTTAALATFTSPPPLLPSTDMHHGRGGGLLNLGQTIVSGLLGGGSHHDDDHRDNNRGGGGGGGGRGHDESTHRSNTFFDQPRRQSSLPGPGRMTGASNDPFLVGGGGGGGGRAQESSSPKRGNVVGSNPGGGSSGGSTPGAPKSTTGAHLPPHELAQAQQAAAASQAAAGTHPGAGAPIAPAAGTPMGAQEKLAMRRFGMDAIGSSQWFGDTEEPVAGQAPRRRFDLRQSEDEVTESVSILDEEHKLPPNVIGDGGR